MLRHIDYWQGGHLYGRFRNRDGIFTRVLIDLKR